MKTFGVLLALCGWLLFASPAQAMHRDDVMAALKGANSVKYPRIIYVGSGKEPYNGGWRLTFGARVFTISSSKSRLIIAYKSVQAIKLHSTNKRIFIYCDR
ncbi:MAG: hypothetical protein H6728_07955 [Myxococcales bacterium]|nr:hypothetical protein [Myxococcales bacterium]MCB9642991.1 hypothetical protein [Myxococcales bacterium]